MRYTISINDLDKLPDYPLSSYTHGSPRAEGIPNQFLIGLASQPFHIYAYCDQELAEEYRRIIQMLFSTRYQITYSPANLKVSGSSQSQKLAVRGFSFSLRQLQLVLKEAVLQLNANYSSALDLNAYQTVRIAIIGVKSPLMSFLSVYKDVLGSMRDINIHIGTLTAVHPAPAGPDQECGSMVHECHTGSVVKIFDPIPSTCFSSVPLQSSHLAPVVSLLQIDLEKLDAAALNGHPMTKRQKTVKPALQTNVCTISPMFGTFAGYAKVKGSTMLSGLNDAGRLDQEDQVLSMSYESDKDDDLADQASRINGIVRKALKSVVVYSPWSHYVKSALGGIPKIKQENPATTAEKLITRAERIVNDGFPSLFTSQLLAQHLRIENHFSFSDGNDLRFFLDDLIAQDQRRQSLRIASPTDSEGNEHRVMDASSSPSSPSSSSSASPSPSPSSSPSSSQNQQLLGHSMRIFSLSDILQASSLKVVYYPVGFALASTLLRVESLQTAINNHGDLSEDDCTQAYCEILVSLGLSNTYIESTVSNSTHTIIVSHSREKSKALTQAAYSLFLADNALYKDVQLQNGQWSYFGSRDPRDKNPNRKGHLSIKNIFFREAL